MESINNKAEDLLYAWNEKLPLKPGGFLLVDDTLRDGLQAPHITTPNFAEKLKLIDQMEKNRIDVCIAHYPAASSIATAQSQVMVEYVENKDYDIILAFAGRTIISDLAPMVELQKIAKKQLIAYAFVGCSPIRQYVEGWDLQTIETYITDSAVYLKTNGLKPVAVFEDATRARPDDLRRLFTASLEAGAEGICLADTVGYIEPSGVRAIMEFARSVAGDDVTLEWHGHDDRGLAVANALTALACGANTIHATSLGIGERAGNLCLEQFLINLYLNGNGNTDISQLCGYAELTSQFLNVPIPGTTPGIGKSVFTTGTGVHAAAVYKALQNNEAEIADLVYSSIPARQLGRSLDIEIGPMSGRANILAKCNSIGLACTEEQLSAVFNAAKRSVRILTENEILEIMNL